jgi:hypothetical protein
MSELSLLAPGVRYNVVLRVEQFDFDWLDESIIEVCQEPRRIDELVRAFALPRRIMEDALTRLLELHQLLLDVAAGTVRATNIPPRFAADSAGEEVWLWQDDATGTVIPWEMVKQWSKGASHAVDNEPSEPESSEEVRLRALSVTRSVMQMSEAELLMHLEPFRRETAWSQRVAQVVRVRSMVLRIPAKRTDDGRVMTMAAYLPSILVLRWQRMGIFASADDKATVRPLLPPRWSEVVGAWAILTHKRIDELQRGRPPLPSPPDPPDEVVCEVLERGATVQWRSDALVALRELVASAGRQVSLRVVVSDRFTTFGDAMMLFREVQESPERVLLAPTGWKANPNQIGKARDANARLLSQPRTDQDFAVIDDRIVIFGLCGAAGSITLRWRRSLLPYMAWIEEVSGSSGLSVGHDPPDEVDRLVARIRNFEAALAEHERMPLAAPAAPGQPEIRSGSLKRLADERASLEEELMASHPVPVSTIEPEQMIELLRTTTLPVRILVRSPASPLVAAAREAEDVAVVVWTEGDPAPPLWYLRGRGPMEVVLLGDDIAMIGCWVDPGIDVMPPFVAVRDRDLVNDLRDVSKAAVRPPRK